MSDCNCRERSRFDPDGNLVLLYTCRACLKYALEKLRKEVDKHTPCMVQLMLLDEDGRLRARTHPAYDHVIGQDGGEDLPF